MVNSINKFTLSKAERMHSVKEIQEIFKTGSSSFTYPFKYYYSIKENECPITEVLISIPKKKVRFAVDRNKLKRFTRDSFRHHKHKLTPKLKTRQMKLSLALVFVGDKQTSHQKIEQAITKIFSALDEKIGIEE